MDRVILSLVNLSDVPPADPTGRRRRHVRTQGGPA